MLVIIEGVDGVGKSTLANRLAEATGATQLHASQPKSNALEEYVQPLHDYLPSTVQDAYDCRFDERHVVCDRWHLGELVYGPIYRGGTIFDGTDSLERVEAFLDAVGAVVVYMTERKDTVMRRWNERGEDFLQPEHYDEAIARYAQATRLSTLPVLRVTGDVRRPVLNRIIMVAEAFSAAASDARHAYESEVRG
jgi:thymidylate kinase